jgi:hypothetical protein
MIHQPESHTVQPSGSSQNIARHGGIFSEVYRRLDFYTKYAQIDSVRIGKKSARHGGNPRWDTRLDSLPYQPPHET